MDEGTTAKGADRRPPARTGGPGRRLTFGSAVLDERSLELTVGGKRVALERRPLDLLLYLLHHAGEVVTKEELAENLWSGRILTESTVTGCISKVRAALGAEGHALIKTAHGFGYRFAGDVRVETVTAPPKPAFSFKPGDAPPLRPQWRLVERLGAGGQAEAWLARHEKTGDARVFKFALDASGLTALKREITLYRLLHDSLGDAAAIVRIFEWNVEEPPYFLETEYLAARDLRTWAEAQGGLLQVSMALRLELTAQIAEALAAAHSVGVLHKDLKPANILVQAGPNPKIKLADFGSGSVLDGGRLEALGITRLGFTKTLHPGETAGTPLYLAPEIMGGQPFTVRADIFALGTILYQMLAGDFSKPLAPGWDGESQDPLLTEDVNLAAAGNPDRRLGDALQLAERLRTVEARREARAAANAAAERAERARKIANELRRMRVYAAVLLTTAAAAVTGGVLAYRARNEAVRATATAKAISDFLTEDVLRADPLVERPREASYESLLRRAAAQVDARFRSEPDAAADTHWLLGRRLHEIGLVEPATAQYERALEISAALHGSGAERSLRVLDRLAWIYVDWNRRSDTLRIAEELPTHWARLHGPLDLSTLLLRIRMARALTFAGSLTRAEEELREILRLIPKAKKPDVATQARMKQWLGIVPESEESMRAVLTAFGSSVLAANVLAEYGDEYVESEGMLRDSLKTLVGVVGEDTDLVAFTRVALGYVLAYSGRYSESEQMLTRARQFFEDWLPPAHYYHSFLTLSFARLRSEQQRPAEAAALVQQALSQCREDDCTPRLRAEYLWEDGRIHAQLGHWQTSTDKFNAALSIYDAFWGPDHVGTIRIRLSLADALRNAGRFAEATAAVSAINPQTVSGLRRQRITVADLRRIEGLLAIEQMNLDHGLAALEESHGIITQRLSPEHWRARRARRELEQLKTRMAKAATD